MQRTSGWNKRYLTNVDKEVVIRSVAQAMPVYAMSIYLLPVSTCLDIERCLNRFWWGSKRRENRTIHWMSWNRLCIPKLQGGLSFKQIREFNIALHGKQSWRLVTNLDSLVEKIFKARYHVNCSFMEASTGYNPSYCWRSIVASQEVIKKAVLGELVMENLLTFGRIIGLQTKAIETQSLLLFQSLLMLKSQI